MNTWGYIIISCFLAVLLAACAFDLVHVKQIPAKIPCGTLKSSGKIPTKLIDREHRIPSAVERVE